ncbi:Bug family tripartite tricarboxylate transporter substrate binding protein [Falsiroseomonas oryzae]|uniref:Bug family tripartite tricarboxylate transporter substrate binding protein n=1 Tax=Falsiroseomonas oryzae TaxID=2766473 RepID=UPI0022EA155C|nr:tripartite tricarboxylate transporter substrate binding protein [Roseomonas sp. MO-31]
MITRRALGGSAAVLALSRAAPAQDSWRPDRPLRFFVGFGAGGVSDAIVRLMAAALAPLLGQPVVVDNRPGASGNLGTLAALQAPPDGHTLGFAGIHLATNPAMLPSLGYDPRADIRMVSQFTSLPIVILASARSGIGSIAELVERARREAVFVSSSGAGTSSHLGPTLLFNVAGGRFEPVQFRSGAEAFQALLAGDTQVMFDPAAAYHAPAAAEGRVRILGVMQDRRSPVMPDVPALGELGLPVAAQMRSWQGVFVRAGTPPAAVSALHRAVVAAVASPEVQGQLTRLGIEPQSSPSPDAAQDYYLSELARWGALLRA